MKESLHYCSPAHGGWGPIRMTQLVPESQLLFCCPSACFRHGALGAFQHGYKNRMAYLYLTREDIIRGYDDILLEGAEEYLCRLEGRLKVLFLFVSCLDDFIGTDLEAILAELSERHPEIMFRACHMNPIAADTKLPPLVTAYQSMMSLLPTAATKRRAVGLFGTNVKLPVSSDLRILLNRIGEELMELPDMEDFAAFQRLGSVRAAIITEPYAKPGASRLAERNRIPALFQPVSYSLSEIKQNYEALGQALGHDFSGELIDWEGKAEAEIAKTREALGGLPLLISDSAVRRPFALAEALHAYGFCVREVSLSKLLPIEREAKTRLTECLPSLRIREALAPERTLDYTQQERSDTLAIGSEVAYYAGSRHLLDLASDEGMYGYDGLIRLMRGLRESAAEEADLRASIEAYGGIV